MGTTLAADYTAHSAEARKAAGSFQTTINEALMALQTLRRTLYNGQNWDIQIAFSFVDCSRIPIRSAQGTLADIHKDTARPSVQPIANSLEQADSAGSKAFHAFVAAQTAIQDLVLAQLDSCMDSLREIVQPKVTAGLEELGKQDELVAQAAKDALAYRSV